MPFIDDTAPADDPTRGPVAQAFALFAGQVERLVVVNVLWAAQFVPAFCAFAFPSMPPAVRLVLIGWSLVAFVPASGVLFALAAYAAQEENIGIERLGDVLRGHALPAVRNLGPLYALTGVLVWALLRALSGPVSWLVVPAGWLLLVAATLSLTWGPAYARNPDASAARLVCVSAVAFWRTPIRSVAVGVIVVLLVALGILSVGGFFLIAPAAVALIQTTHFRTGAGPWATSASAG